MNMLFLGNHVDSTCSIDVCYMFAYGVKQLHFLYCKYYVMSIYFNFWCIHCQGVMVPVLEFVISFIYFCLQCILL